MHLGSKKIGGNACQGWQKRGDFGYPTPSFLSEAVIVC